MVGYLLAAPICMAARGVIANVVANDVARKHRKYLAY
jgi:hypothetical protein